jgi:outer membrane protein OmpA-like peptidoglycan-associated protein
MAIIQRDDHVPLLTVLFEFREAKLTRAAFQQLERLAPDLLRAARPLTLTGYTDSIGFSPYNLHLGQRRAEAVRDHLITLGLPGHHR